MKSFANETEGQLYFFNTYLLRVNSALTLEDILQDSNDGVLNGNILEFKLVINDLNATLFQAIKYLSSMRIKGKSIPKNIVLISLNKDVTYVFDSAEYIAEIECIYIGGASKQNSGFKRKSEPKKLHLNEDLDAEELINLLRQTNYTKINLDENCIIGWANRYYLENPTANKSDFIGDAKSKTIGEIRSPVYFQQYIEPYKLDTNEQFRYLMDKLNDDRLKKDLGAFYTPSQYVELSTKFVRQAIKRVPKGNDYIILDRCAGTGNLEQFLTDDELSHCIVSTYEYYEYKVLMKLIGDKVRHVIPPVEKSNTFQNGKVLGADALSKEYIENAIIKKYIDNEKCTIIILENPPYAEVNGNTRVKKSTAIWRSSFAFTEMKKFLSTNKTIPGHATNDVANIFIWSAFNYYLRQDTDSYILFSPVKYWKAQHLVNKKFVNGYAFNRRFFHTKTDACISCILWSNESSNITKLKLNAYNIVADKVVNEGKLLIQRVYKPLSDMMKVKVPYTVKGVACDLNGLETSKSGRDVRVTPIFDAEIVGYLVCNGFGFDNPRLNGALVRCGRYDGNGSFITKKDYLYKLPLFAAAKYTDNANAWTVMSQVMKSSDGQLQYARDFKSNKLSQWILKVLLWSSLTNQSHMRSFTGSDSRSYKNEICLDDTNGDTLALTELKKLVLQNSEVAILNQWNAILKGAKLAKNYKSTSTYGVYQIEDELNTSVKVNDIKGRTQNVYDYPQLNGDLNTLRVLLQDYYLKEIAPTLFKYALLK